MAIHSIILDYGKSHGQRSVVGYSPRDYKKSDVTELAHKGIEVR